MVPTGDDASLRILVKGIRKGPVQRYGKNIKEENDLRLFFHDAGCNVAAVRLVLDDKRGGKSRGFSFVDFKDHQSLELALTLHNKEAKGLAEKDGNLCIEKAHAASDPDHQSPERAPRLHNREAKGLAEIDGHMCIEKAHTDSDPELQTCELALKLHNKEAKGLAEKDGNLCIEKAHAASDPDHQSPELAPRLHNKEAEGLLEKDGNLCIEKVHAAEMESKFAFCEARLNEDLQAEQAKVGIQNTFIEVLVAEALPLARTKTAPPRWTK